MRSFRCWMVVGLALAASSCGDSAAPPDTTVASVEITPAVQTLNWVGANRQLSAVARNSAGDELIGTTFTWSSAQPAVATVHTSSGLVTAASNGIAAIIAAAGGVTDTATVQVQQVVKALTVTPALDTILAAGQTLTFTAAVVDSGNVAVSGATVRWSSSNLTVATMDSVTGLALAVAPGTVTITARAGTVTGPATLLVRNGTLVGNRVLLTDYGNIQDNDYVVDDYFVVWWDDAYNYATEALQILDWLKGIKAEALQLGMAHPPHDARGTYLNVYIHEPGPGNDNYPDGWGAGVGTDGNDLPFLSVGSSQRNDPQLFRHEGFHLYQYTGSRASPGFNYNIGDASWYTEASATWFSTLGAVGTQDYAHLGAATVVANPQLALWHGWTNEPPGDPDNWNRTTRQYALATWLEYLTSVASVPVSVLVEGYNTPTTMVPQQLLNTRVAGLGAIFADYAAVSTPDMPYLTRPQWNAAVNELATYGDPADNHQYVLELTNTGTGGLFVEPAAALRPRGWGWNVIRISSTQSATWQFVIDGDPTGSAGAAAVLQARLKKRTATGDTIYTVPLTGSLDGSLTVTSAAVPTEYYLIVAAVPLHFRDHQTYAYRVRIDRN